MNRRSAVTMEIVQESRRMLVEHGVMTLRHLYYLLISAGVIQNSQSSYTTLVRVISVARRRGEIPYSALVDGTRSIVKPSSWSGLGDFTDTVREAYRKDLWQQQEQYLEIWCEKDAIVGVIEPITREYDICLRPLRGYSSLTFIHFAAAQLSKIRKPTTIYYLGDHDPSGYDIERSARESLNSMLNAGGKRVLEADVTSHLEEEFGVDLFAGAGVVRWERLAITPDDIEAHNLLPFPAKRKDSRYEAFRREHGAQAVELDALPPDILRDRLSETVERHIDQRAWKKLKRTEQAERESFNRVLSHFKN